MQRVPLLSGCATRVPGRCSAVHPRCGSGGVASAENSLHSWSPRGSEVLTDGGICSAVSPTTILVRHGIAVAPSQRVPSVHPGGPLARKSPGTMTDSAARLSFRPALCGLVVALLVAKHTAAATSAALS